MLIHAAKRWPNTVTANLWPYAIRMANEASLEIPSLKFNDGRTPLQAFAGSRATTNPKFWQPFACPIYVLNNASQTAGGIHGKCDTGLSFIPVHDPSNRDQTGRGPGVSSAVRNGQAGIVEPWRLPGAGTGTLCRMSFTA